MRQKIIVIGSGFGGLATAIRLAALGHHVELFEKRDKLGGRAYVYEMNGFRFDSGPTVITAPFLFDDLFFLADKRREDYITFVPSLHIKIWQYRKQPKSVFCFYLVTCALQDVPVAHHNHQQNSLKK